MRRIGTLSDRSDAERFGDYLLTRQIKSKVETAGDEWAVWVFDEDRLDDARQELEVFQSDPKAQKYQQAIVEADRLRHDEVRKRTKAKKRTVHMAQRWQRPMIAQIPVTFALIVLSVFVTIGTEFGKQMSGIGGKLAIIEVRSDGEDSWIAVDPRTGDRRRSDTGLAEVRGGEIWRLVTPIFIHMSPWHLLFNMYWTVVFGSLIETRQSSRMLLAVVLLTAVVSNLTQYQFQSFGFGGMSGVGYGMFGYLLMQQRMNPRSEIVLPPNLVFLFIAWLFVCMTGAVGPIANYAHAFGLISGAALGAARGLRDRALGK